MDLRRRVDRDISRLTERVESIETPYLDFVGELLLLKQTLENIEGGMLGLDRDAVREAADRTMRKDADRAKRKGRGPGATRQGGLIHEKPVLH